MAFIKALFSSIIAAILVIIMILAIPAGFIFYALGACFLCVIAVAVGVGAVVYDECTAKNKTCQSGSTPDLDPPKE